MTDSEFFSRMKILMGESYREPEPTSTGYTWEWGGSVDVVTERPNGFGLVVESRMQKNFYPTKEAYYLEVALTLLGQR